MDLNEITDSEIRDIKTYITTPLYEAKQALKEKNVVLANEKITYAQNNVPTYSSTKHPDMRLDIEWKIKLTKGLLPVSSINIDKAYALALRYKQIEQYTKELITNVRPTLNNEKLNAKTTGIEDYISIIKEYSDAIYEAIKNTQKLLDPINTELKKLDYNLEELGYVEPK